VAVALSVDTIGGINSNMDGGVIRVVSASNCTGSIEVGEDSASFNNIALDRAMVASREMCDFFADVISCLEEEGEIASERLEAFGTDWGFVDWFFEEVGKRWCHDRS
jgi:hypothetical protein